MALKSADIPVLLFPLRIETRFVGSELWIRALPDEAFMQSHELKITIEEQKDILSFKEELQNNHATLELKEKAKKEKWQNLVAKYGAFRASYLVHLADKKTVAEIKSIVILKESEEQDFYFKGMPERLIAYLYPTGSDEIITIPGREIKNRDKLVVFGEGDDWVNDFQKATEAGVAMIARAEDLKNHTSFDKIIVVGFYYRDEDRKNDEKSVDALKELFENHLYTEGISFLDYGTATNNLGKEKSGHTLKKEFDSENTYDYLVNGTELESSNNNPLFDTLKASRKLAAALGMEVSTFKHFDQAQLQTPLINKLFKKISWFSLGKQTLRMLYKDDISNEAHEFLWKHYEEYVDARGPLSAIKIGDQPYAILPVTSIKQTHRENNVDTILAKNDYLSKASLLLSILFEEWKEMVNQANIPQVNATQEIHRELLKIMSMQPNSTSYQLSVLEYDKYRGQLPKWLEDAADLPANFANLPIAQVYELLKDKSEIAAILQPHLENYTELEKLLSKDFIKNENILNYIQTEKQLSHAELMSFKYHKTLKINTVEKDRKPNIDYLDIALIPEKSVEFDELAALKEVFNQVLTIGNGKSVYNENRLHLLKYKGKKLSLFSDLLLRGYTNAIQLYHRIVHFQPSIEDLLLFKGAETLIVKAINQNANKGQVVITLWDGVNNNRVLKIKKPFKGIISSDGLYVKVNDTIQAGQRLFRIQDKTKEYKIAKEIALLSIQLIESIENMKAEDRQKAMKNALSEAIDLNSYRIDAWITSLATCRLKQQRTINPKGIYFGAYGWVENLKKDTDRPVSKDDMRDVSRVDDGGIIHCPSPAQALTATLFKNSFLSYKDSDIATNPFTLNLTSDRIQKGEKFMEGIRQDQRIEVLLGYQLERALHERRLNVELYDLRAVFPLEENRSTSIIGQTSTITQLSVIDGLKLLKASQLEEKEETGLTDNQILVNRKEKLINEIKTIKAYLQVGTDTTPENLVAKIFPFIQKLEDTLDGSLDTLFFEAGYQLVNGNLTQSAAAIDATKGIIEPPKQESLKTPITGTGIQHQVAMIFPQAPKIRQVEKGKAFAAPVLEYWLSQQLGNLSNIKCQVELFEEEEQLIEKTKIIHLGELGISHSDLLYLSEEPVSDGAGELEIRIWNHYLNTFGPIDDTINYKINTQSIGTSLGNALEFARYTFRLLQQSHFLKSEDLKMSDEEPIYDWAALHAIKTQRLDVIIKALDISESQLPAKLEFLVQFDLEMAKLAMMKQEQPNTKKLKQELDKKLNKAKAFLELYNKGYSDYQQYKEGKLENSPDYYALFNFLLKAAKALFGPAFMMLPPALSAKKYTSVINIGQQAKLIGHTDLNNNFSWGTERIQSWLQGVAQVEKGIACLEEWQMIQSVWRESNSNSSTTNFSIIQGPTLTTQPWVGLSKKEMNALLESGLYANTGLNKNNIEYYPKGSESMVLMSDSALSFVANRPQYGLIITSFTEHVPDESINTGLSFHYNAPNNEAPQALLLAVAPPKELRDIDDWLETGLRDIVEETIDLAKIRMVDLDAMQKYGFVLPMTYWFNIPTVN